MLTQKFRSRKFKVLRVILLVLAGVASVTIPAADASRMDLSTVAPPRATVRWQLTQTWDDSGEIVLSYVSLGGWLRNKSVHFGWMQPGEDLVTINDQGEDYQVPFAKVTSLLAKADPELISRWTFEDWELWFQLNDIHQPANSKVAMNVAHSGANGNVKTQQIPAHSDQATGRVNAL